MGFYLLNRTCKAVDGMRTYIHILKDGLKTAKWIQVWIEAWKNVNISLLLSIETRRPLHIQYRYV